MAVIQTFAYFCDNNNGARNRIDDDYDDDIGALHNRSSENKRNIENKSAFCDYAKVFDYLRCNRYDKCANKFNQCISVRKLCGLVAGILIVLNGLSVVNGDTDTRPNIHALQSSEEFSKYAIVRPTFQHSRHKRDIQSTRLEDGLHADSITLKYEHEGKDVIIDLNLNYNLIPQGHFLRYQTPNGGKIVQNFTKTDIDLCHYQGTIRGNEHSRVAISTCNGAKGLIFDGTETFYIDTQPNSTISDDHFLYRHSDMTRKTKCGYENGINKTHNMDYHYHMDSDMNRFQTKFQRYKRSSDSDTIIRGPYNANKHSSFVELVLVVDNKVYKALGENLKKVHSHCQDIANIINALYVPLNIFIALVGIVVWNESNEAEVSSDGDKTLKSFLQYRRKVLVKDHPNDNAQLLTKEQFEGGVVGKALKGPICTYEYSGGVSMDHSQSVNVVATTVAHEMGHNFGMEHDSPDCKCQDDKCIMSPSSSSEPPLHWSSCSIDQLNLAFHQGMNYCLKNRPTRLFDSPQCGNGFVEPGEQCDCGLLQFCENTCCDPKTCMLHTNASCATGACCDLTTCHPRTAGTICRTADGECDLPEYCTGESEYCPSDYFKRDTESCDGGQAYCYQGSCRSRDDQCKILWGPSGSSSDQCYDKNIEGTRHGNCGYDRIANLYVTCSKSDTYCGMLQCRHLNERLEFGMENAAVLSHSFITYNGSVIPCRAVIVDLGLHSVDPGLVPDGAKCDENKMCVHQKCLSLESLRANGMAPACPENCSGHGICNNNGACHCDDGFAPPLCNTPGPGGSENSGPATNPNEGAGVVRVMYVFFLGVVPFISLILFFIYYWRQNRPLILRKTPNVLKQIAPKQNHRTSGGGSTSPSVVLTSTPSSTDDMNSSLLKSIENNDSSLLNNNMFGHFKGFTLKPLPNSRTPQISAPNVAFVHPVAKTLDQSNISNGVPSRIAPPVPKLPNVQRNQTQVKPIKPLINLTNSNLSMNKGNTEAPALPPFNPGSAPRPLISSPILEASTCSAKELISPLRHTAEKYPDKLPVRPAPSVPTAGMDQLTQSRFDGQMNKDKKPKETAIQRIASFLKKDDKIDSNTLSKITSKMKPSINKEKLKNIEISSPIPAIDSSDAEDMSDNSNISRTQSMRDPSVSVVKRTNIQTFGSMRHPSTNKRPGSIVGTRPKSPPPPRPPAPPSITSLKIPGVPGYQNPPAPKKIQAQNDYDDCEAIEAPLANITEDISPTNSDNIYSVIDEYQSPPKLLSPPEISNSNNDSMGLLGEIVNEIENRNLDSIYSVSTLNRKKQSENNSSYLNTSDINDYSDSEYMNMKSNGSTTSSGYLRPSAINTPIARVAPVKPSQTPTKPISNNLSSFKRKDEEESNVKPNITSFQRPPDTITTEDETTKTVKPLNKYLNRPTPIGSSAKPSLTVKTNLQPDKQSAGSKLTTPPSPTTKKVQFNRTKTPPNIQSNSIRTRSPSPSQIVLSKTAIQTNKTLKSTPIVKSTAPDLVNSITANKAKQPDVLNSGQKPKPLTKPALSSTEAIHKSNAQNSSEKPKWQSSNKVISIDNNKVSSSTSKMLKAAAARPGLAKSSNVASLQQRFESTGSSKDKNSASNSKTITTLKK